MEEQKKNISIKCLSGPNINDMKHYRKKPPKKINLNVEVVIIHASTSNLSYKFKPKNITTNIINLVAESKNKFNHQSF